MAAPASGKYSPVRSRSKLTPRTIVGTARESAIQPDALLVRPQEAIHRLQPTQDHDDESERAVGAVSGRLEVEHGDDEASDRGGQPNDLQRNVD
eukprot:4355698-Prymnesium_polylepis.2